MGVNIENVQILKHLIPLTTTVHSEINLADNGHGCDFRNTHDRPLADAWP
jgi:hypothetical protein